MPVPPCDPLQECLLGKSGSNRIAGQPDRPFSWVREPRTRHEGCSPFCAAHPFEGRLQGTQPALGVHFAPPAPFSSKFLVLLPLSTSAFRSDVFASRYDFAMTDFATGAGIPGIAVFRASGSTSEMATL